MYIKKLTINSNSAIIREINFNNNVNIITTPEEDERGNNVGKSTVIDLIDIALGADITTKKKRFSDEISNLINSKNISIVLELQHDQNLHSLEINLNTKQHAFDGVNKTYKEYGIAIRNLLFDDVPENIANRKLISRFFIFELPISEEKIIRYLDFNGKSNKEMLGVYEATYGYFLNPTNKKQLITDLLHNRIKQFSAESSKPKSINISEANSVLSKSFTSIEGYTEKNQLITAYANRINQVQSLVLDANLIKESIEKPEVSLDQDVINLLLKELAPLIPNEHEAFEKIVSFNKSREANRIIFLQKQLDKLNTEIALKNGEIVNIKSQLEKMVNFKEESFNLDNVKKTVENNFKSEINNIVMEKSNVSISQSQLDELFSQKNLGVFNAALEDISEKIIGEKYSIKLSDKLSPANRSVPIEFETNQGSGTGRLHQLSFSFVASLIVINSKRVFPKFILQDINEVTDEEPFESMFSIAVRNNIQFIVPILGTKVSAELKQKFPPVLTLSSDDRLFEPKNNNDAFENRP